MEKNLIKVVCSFVLIVFSIHLITSLPNDAQNSIDFEYPTSSFDNATAYVNNSQYLQGLTPQQVADLKIETDPVFTAWDKDYDDLTNKPDLSVYWKSDGTSTASGNWNIGAYNFTTTGNITANTFYGDGSNLTGITWNAEDINVNKSYEFYLTGDDSSNGHYGNNRWAQTFTIGTTGDNEDFYITDVKLKTWRIGNPGIITIGIYAVDTGTGKPTGSALTTGTFDGDSVTPSSSGEWKTISLTPYLLSSATKYAIVSSGGFGGSDMINYRVDSSSPTYTGGQAFLSTDAGSSWTGYSHDFIFEVLHTKQDDDFLVYDSSADEWFPRTINLSGINSESIFDLSDFPADPDADKFLKWDDTAGELVWADSGSSVSFGTDNQIPYMNAAGDDFDYISDFTFAPVTDAGGTGVILTISDSNGPAILRLSGGGTTSSLGNARFQFFMPGRSGQSANTKNFAFNNANSYTGQSHNTFNIQARNDDGSYKANLMMIQHDGMVGIGDYSTSAPPTEMLQIKAGHIWIDTDFYKIKFGAGQDASIKYDGTNMVFTSDEVGNGIAYFSSNVSASDFIDRTSVYDKSKGNALDFAKDSSELTTNGKINHSEFYGYTTFEMTDMDRPENITKEVYYCNYKTEGETEVSDETKLCEDGSKPTKVTISEIVYPYTKTEEGVSMSREISLLRQQVYELKELNQELNNRLNKLCAIAPKGTC